MLFTLTTRLLLGDKSELLNAIELARACDDKSGLEQEFLITPRPLTLLLWYGNSVMTINERFLAFSSKCIFARIVRTPLPS